jgi:O-antigen ligase
VTRGNLPRAFVGAIDLFKVVSYFVLLLAVIDSPQRLGIFLSALVISVFLISLLAVFQYYEVLGLKAPHAIEQIAGFDESGEAQVFRRLQATGIFGDPNDFSLALVTALLLCVHVAIEQHGILCRLLWLAPMGVLSQAFSLTLSRGGLLAAAAGALAYSAARWSWKGWVPTCALLLPLLLLSLGGRQTNLNLDDPEDTAQQRLELWRDAIELTKSAPLLGVGHERLSEELGYVAHNSYVHCFAELGFFGGTLFVGAFALPLMELRRAGKMRNRGAFAADLVRWYPAILAVLVAYMVGLCSLTRSYTLMTYLVIGVAVAYCNLVAVDVPAVIKACGVGLFARVVAVSIVVLLTFNLFMRVMVC